MAEKRLALLMECARLLLEPLRALERQRKIVKIWAQVEPLV